MLRMLYVIAIGLLFAAFIGFGVVTFYQAPESPWQNETPITEKTLQPSVEEQEAQRQEQLQYQQESETYQRNLSLIFMAIAVLVIVISIFGLGKIDVIGDGITLGGVFLLFAGIVSSFASGEETFRFVAVTIGLAVVIFLSYWKFVRHPDQQTT